MNEFLDIEQITLHLQSLEIKLTCIYRPPSINSDGHNSICKLISNICDSINPTIIVGDFNLPLFNWNDNSFHNYPSCYSLFYNTLVKNSLVQLIKFPTRSMNVLDLLLTNSPLILSDINECPEFETGTCISDHISFSFTSFLHLYLPKVNDYGLNFRKLNYPAMQESLSKIDWIQLFDGDHDINYMFEIFYKTLYGIFDIYVPKHKLNKKVNNYPNHIVKLKLKCFKLFKKRLNSHNNFIAWN